jgi:hypothetical protein
MTLDFFFFNISQNYWCNFNEFVPFQQMQHVFLEFYAKIVIKHTKSTSHIRLKSNFVFLSSKILLSKN